MATRQQTTDNALYVWKGKDKTGKAAQGEMRAGGAAVVAATLRRQGIAVTKVTKKRFARRKRITEKDIAIFTRQLATMLKAGIPLLQCFDILAQGQSKASLQELLHGIRKDVETGTSLHQAFRKHPLQFNDLFCSLIAAGEQAGILEQLLERLAAYKEKTLSIKSKIRAAVIYPIAILSVAFGVTSVIMIWVIPAFKEVFSSFGAELPGPTMVVVAMSDFVVQYSYVLFGAIIGGIYFFLRAWKRSRALQMRMDKWLLRLPVLGMILQKAVLSRWSRTLATMFAAGIPLIDSLESVGAASGNIVYANATKVIRNAVQTGTSLTMAMENTEIFPNLITQMVSIGEESGSLDHMLNKAADFFDTEVDEAVAAMSSLMEPFIIVVLGVLIGGLVVALYLPIFKLGAVV